MPKIANTFVAIVALVHIILLVVERTPLLIQTAPGAIALSLLWISKSQANKHLGTQGNL